MMLRSLRGREKRGNLCHVGVEKGEKLGRICPANKEAANCKLRLEGRKREEG